MPSILSQREIDALLSALPVEDASSSTAMSADLVRVGKPVKTYDFRHPSKFSRDQIRTVLREQRNQYVFEVQRDANKIEIKRAVETIFNVKVASVRTQQMRGKIRRQGRFVGKRSDWKKAIVTLGPDQKIELFEQI